MMSATDPPAARTVTAGPGDAGQRIDNFLARHLKGVPKTRIYRALRKGEVRVNGHRTRPHYHLVDGDRVRIPPIRYRGSGEPPVVPLKLLDQVPVLFEDGHILVVDKPAGLAVHGGSGMEFGLVEALRQLRPDLDFLELVHRLDRETSGCLMLALGRPALVALQRQLAERRGIRKHYLALVKGVPSGGGAVTVDRPLRQVRGRDGKKQVVVDAEGQQATTVFRIRRAFADTALLEAELLSGRMHQARVHAAHMGHPVAGDRLYGDGGFNARMQGLGLGRLFLHAERLRIHHPHSGLRQDFFAPLPAALESVLAGQ